MLSTGNGIRLLDLALARVQDIVETSFKNVTDELIKIPESKVPEFITTVIDPISKYIFDNMPKDLIPMVHTAIRDRLQYVMYQNNPLSNYELCLMYLVGCHENLPEMKMHFYPIDTSDPEVLDGVNRMQEMITFRNKFIRSYCFEVHPPIVIPQSIMSFMIERFTYVTELVLRGTNDRILGQALTTCGKLVKLDLSQSTGVTDRSVFGLVRASKLRYIDLTLTRISTLGYTILFNKMKEVKYFGHSFPFLTMTEDAINRNKTGFALEKAALYIDGPTVLPDFSKVVPLLRNLVIVMNENNDQNCVIACLQQLGNLSLAHITVHKARVGRVMEYFPGGMILNSLNSLEIYFAPDVNVEALKLLDALCPNLQSLKLRLCSEPFQVPFNFENGTIFKHLQDFQCESSTLNAWSYGRILANCHDIRTIMFKNCLSNELNDEWLANVLRENSLKQLDSIFIDRCQITEEGLTAMLLDGHRIVRYIHVVYKEIFQHIDPGMVLETLMGNRVYTAEVLHTLHLLADMLNGPEF